MKKAYVKPVMESEAFVANEYVAACWDVYCQGSWWGYFHQAHGYVDTYKSDKAPDPSSDDEDPFTTTKVFGVPVYFYGDHYDVKWEPTPGHPNASV